MDEARNDSIRSICQSYGNDRLRLLDIAIDVQRKYRCVDSQAADTIAAALDIGRVDVESVVSFYSFLSSEELGRVVIRLSTDVIDEMKGAEEVARAFELALGIGFGETTADGRVTLERAACIGMSDQAPAALANDFVLPHLTAGKATRVAEALLAADLDHLDDLPSVLQRDYGEYGGGNNAHHSVRSTVHNNVRLAGEVILTDMKPGAALQQVHALTPAEVIRMIKTSRLRGRGGAGFPTGMKWEFTRGGGGGQRYVICNADEGEPGTFKDRVILTQRPDLLFEGMTIAGYAIGATKGLLYLRGEYTYLRSFLEEVLAERHERGLLGRNICGKDGFDFDVRIQMGAGAYICGEETALISSCEGKRGDPKNRPPFPAQRGYLGKPTSVNNVETLCCAARIVEMGAGWFSSMGSSGSAGTKLLSVSGDCHQPGIYEVPFGITLRELLALAGAEEPLAVQVGGPSGSMVGEADFDRRICFDDLATNGSMMVFGPSRDLLQVVSRFMGFFAHESCGYCTPCRVGNVLLKQKIDEIIAGHGESSDLAYLHDLATTVKTTSRCGLGQTSPNPVLSTLEKFRSVYDERVHEPDNCTIAAFDLNAALEEARSIQADQYVQLGGVKK